MKKFTTLLLILAAVLFTASMARAYTWSSDLKLGSQGSDVTALQEFLISRGFHIPAIESGVSPKGTFGGQTKKAVQSFQASQKISTTGTVGPLTRAALNGQTTMQNSSQVKVDSNLMTMACPAGYVCSPNTSAVVTSVPIQQNILTVGVPGTLVPTLQATPANGTSVSKGQSVDVASYKIQTGSSDMALSNIQIDFNTRLWLYAGSITVKDENNKIIVTKSNLSSNDFIELTSGSSYRLALPVANYIVAHGMTKYFTVNLSFLPVTDRTSATISITRFATRSIDGTGVNDDEQVASTRTMSYTGTTNGQVVMTADPYGPPNMRVPISLTTYTDNVVMGIADFTSQAVDGLLRSMQIYVNTNRDGITPITTLFADIKLQVGSSTYSATTIGTYDGFGTPVTFSNLSIPLPKDTVVPVTILVKVNPDTNNSLDNMAASSTLIASGTAGGASNNPLIEDSSYTPIDINDAPLATSDMTFSASDSFIDLPVATLGKPVLVNNVTAAYSATFSFTVTAGVNTLYLSKDPNVALATSSVGLASNKLASLTDVVSDPSTLSGDTSTYYVILPGATRKFTYAGVITNTGGTSGLKILEIDGVRYGTSPSSLSTNTVVYYNYGVLKVTPTF